VRDESLIALPTDQSSLQEESHHCIASSDIDSIKVWTDEMRLSAVRVCQLR